MPRKILVKDSQKRTFELDHEEQSRKHYNNSSSAQSDRLLIRISKKPATQTRIDVLDLMKRCGYEEDDLY